MSCSFFQCRSEKEKHQMNDVLNGIKLMHPEPFSRNVWSLLHPEPYVFC
jgi:hypothetical protein